MAGERIDYSIERQRHERFVGRKALLERLDQLLVAEGPDRWVVVTGGPGMGKSALLAAWLARREAAGAAVPHHFIRRGEYDWDDPAKLVGSLVAQIERLAELQEPDADARRHPAARLVAMLTRVSARLSDRMVIMIDGLDEYDPPAQIGDPLKAFLPHVLPRGVSLVCASRPRHPYVSSLEARDAGLVRIDLDDPSNAADNDATVRRLWEEDAPPLGLDARFVDAAVTSAGGNVQHAVTLQKHLAALPVEQRRVEKIPTGLGALLERSWERLAIDPAVVGGLGILCAAREALTLDELGAVAGWTDCAQRRAFLHGACELLIKTRRPDRQVEYRLHHDSIRSYIAGEIGTAALHGHHAELARRLAKWPAPPGARLYALRHALIHRVEAGEWEDAWRLAADTSFLEAKYRELGAHEVEADVARIAERCRANGDATIGRRFADLARALVSESHWLRAAPEATAAIVWNRLRRSGWCADDIDKQLQIPSGALYLRLRHAVPRSSPALVRDLVGHTTEVIACAVAPDDRSVVSTSFMGCAVTPDGQCVVSASFDKTLKIWHLDSGRVLATLDGHTSWVTACVVIANGRRVVSGADDGTLKVWELESGREIVTLKGHHTGQVNACAATADGRYVVSGSNDGTLKVWDSESGQTISTLKGHADWVRACAVTMDGRHVVSGSYDGTLKIWDLESGRVLATLEEHTDWVRACAVTADGRRVVSGSRDGTLKVWDLESRRALTTLRGHTGWVLACAVTADGRRVVSGSTDRTVRVWDLESGRELAILKGHADWVRTCAVTADGRYAVSGSADGTLKIWDLDRALATLISDADRVRACAMTADGRRMVSGCDDGTLRLWDLQSGRVLVTLEESRSGVRACAVMANGQCMVSGSDDGTLKLWDLPSERVLATLEGHTDRVNACAVTADGQRVVSGSDDGTLRVWDTGSRRVLTILEGHRGGVRACAVTADGRRMISGSSDRTLKIWDLETGRMLATLYGHTNWVNACAVTEDGKRVVSASYDRTLKVWDLETGRMLATLHGHTDWVYACAVTADGKHVVSASYDRTLKVWDLETHACLVTHRGDAAYAAVAVTATAITAGDIAGAVWILDWPPSRHTEPLRISHGGEDHHESNPANETSLSRQLIKRHTILFLAANPRGTDRLALDQEVRAIQVELERSGHRDCFELVTWWAAEPLDLLRELRKLKPTVVHFSGHGSSDEHRPDQAPRRSLGGIDPNGDEPGLYFQGPDGRAQLVSTAALEETFGAVEASVKLVVLNACYSEVQAEALLAHVDCVVGMSGSIRDDAARSFAIGFYGGLGARESIAAAYKQGRAAISLEGLRDGDRPQLRVRAGVDASRLVLAADPR